MLVGGDGSEDEVFSVGYRPRSQTVPDVLASNPWKYPAASQSRTDGKTTAGTPSGAAASAPPAIHSVSA